MDADDKALAQAAASGDRAAFAALVARHHARLVRVAWRITGSQSSAEDIAQEVCIALPGKLRTWRGEGKLTTWLHTLTLNAARDHLRREATYGRARAGWGDAVKDAQHDATAQSERANWLAEAMALLSTDLHETVALITEGVSHAEAADALGISEGTVSWRMNRARTLLSAHHKAEEQT